MGILNIDAYPCRWPDGWERTPSHRRGTSRFGLDFVRARDDISRQLKLMGAREIVLTTNIPLRRDGLPLAGQSEPQDPAVAVYWIERGTWNAQRNEQDYKRLVVACDHWRKVKENLRAVGVTIECLRALKRSGATHVIERAFMGFAALPEQAGQRSWRQVLELGDGPVSRDMLDRAYRAMALWSHPDRGGTNEGMAAVNRAYEDGLREIGGRA